MTSKGRDKTYWIGTLSLLLSVIAIIFSGYTYWDTTKPHSQFEEISKKLDIVGKEITETEAKLEIWRKISNNNNSTFEGKSIKSNVSDYEEYLEQSKRLYWKARGHLINDNYTKAEELTKEAHKLANKVPNPKKTPTPFQGLPGFEIVIAVIGIILALHIIKRKNSK